MANIRKRNKHWQVRIQRKDGPQQSKTFTTYQEAKLWARKVEREYDLYINDLPPKTISLHEALNRYLKEVTPRKKRPEIETYRVRAWLKSNLSQKLITHIKTSDLVIWRNEMIKQNYQPNTIRLHLAVLSHLYSIAQSEWGFEHIKNPVQHLHTPKLPPARESRISDDDIERLIENTDSPFLPSMIYFALHTGMRRSELTRLKWQNIDLDRSKIHLLETKNGEHRIIPLFNSIQELLQQIPKTDPRVFPITEHAVTIAFRRSVIRSNLTNMSFHTLRHEAISRFFEQGLSIPEVAMISGHKSWSMLKRYTHLQNIMNLKQRGL